MAVVFISPKQRQKVFFLGITIMFLLLLAVISLVVLLAAPKEVSPVLAFNKPKVNIDMSVFDSDQFKSLQPFPEMEIQYSYTAIDKNNKTVSGFVSAVSADEARKSLADKGLTVSDVKEAEIGRDNPFVPYSPIVTKSTSASKIK